VKRLRKNEHREVEAILRECRPQLQTALLAGLVADVSARRRRRRGAPRTALALAFTVALFAVFAAFGGIGYASSAMHAADLGRLGQIVGVSNATPASSGGGSATHNPTFDQYRPGKGCGDKNHIHLRENECKKPPK
jgi:hypothetical protein